LSGGRLRGEEGRRGGRERGGKGGGERRRGGGEVKGVWGRKWGGGV